MKIINVAGARPNFIKIAPLIAEMEKYQHIQQVLVHTGQHYDENLSKIFFDDLAIPRPDINMGIGSGAVTREQQIEQISQHFSDILKAEKPDLVLVVGDVNSTIACASAAKEQGIKVAHVESGLRSFDLTMPEELNRIATDKISDFLYVTEVSGMENLKEGGMGDRAHLVGNVMIDSLVKMLEKSKRHSSTLSSLHLEPGMYLVSTFHRPGNVDEKSTLQHLISAISIMTSHFPLVMPLHPRTKHSLERLGLLAELEAIPGLNIVDPMGYLDFINLVSQSAGVVTDSGGIQEETSYLKVPCVTMRPNTERPVTIDQGTNVLIGSDLVQLKANLASIQEGSFKQGHDIPLWDGKASSRIIEHLRQQLS
ncbi:UDP-N-acetylglucosamine 2-epimerase [Candidatus Endobugula sertula]|uniref:UDP-N-acetylglucosamine 2-epimerase n=1 Tax=Candidatus Endobugula sertula TaxID=62101 RepID=A0A1D2QP59_9GAMM|nr:UDP-N-acetylglucosamine 2-epimerase [Candidatus Endobugula sertula]